MRYLSKRTDSAIPASDWIYPKDAKPIREALREEQIGYCAYSEKWIGNIDAHEVEHFDPRMKHTTNDGYENWYCVLRWMNQHKPKKIEPFLPILLPSSPGLQQRIIYQDGIFAAAGAEDLEAENLIRFLGWNKPEVAKDRYSHLSRLRDLKTLCLSEQEFQTQVFSRPDNLSFRTAVEAEFPELR